MSHEALLADVAAKLEIARLATGAKKVHLAHGRLAERTVWALFHGHDHYLTTLAELADAMGYDLVIELRRRDG